MKCLICGKKYSFLTACARAFDGCCDNVCLHIRGERWAEEIRLYEENFLKKVRQRKRKLNEVRK